MHTQRLYINFNYKTGYISAQQIKILIQSIKQLCTSLNENIETLLGNLRAITNQELSVLKSWNETEYRYPKDKCIHQLFEESAQSNPDRIAVIYEEQQIIYEVLKLINIIFFVNFIYVYFYSFNIKSFQNFFK